MTLIQTLITFEGITFLYVVRFALLFKSHKRKQLPKVTFCLEWRSLFSRRSISWFICSWNVPYVLFYLPFLTFSSNFFIAYFFIAYIFARIQISIFKPLIQRRLLQNIPENSYISPSLYVYELWQFKSRYYHVKSFLNLTTFSRFVYFVESLKLCLSESLHKNDYIPFLSYISIILSQFM